MTHYTLEPPRTARKIADQAPLFNTLCNRERPAKRVTRNPNRVTCPDCLATLRQKDLD